MVRRTQLVYTAAALHSKVTSGQQQSGYMWHPLDFHQHSQSIHMAAMINMPTARNGHTLVSHTLKVCVSVDRQLAEALQQRRMVSNSVQ